MYLPLAVIPWALGPQHFLQAQYAVTSITITRCVSLETLESLRSSVEGWVAGAGCCSEGLAVPTAERPRPRAAASRMVQGRTAPKAFEFERDDRSRGMSLLEFRSGRAPSGLSCATLPHRQESC